MHRGAPCAAPPPNHVCLPACSVHSFQAAAVAVTETTAVEADDGGWVHFGAAHFSLRMLVSTSSPMMDEDDIPAELHIEYGEWEHLGAVLP